MKPKYIYLLTFILILFSCHSRQISTEVKIEINETVQIDTITFVAAGDNLIHDSFIRDGLTEDGTYDFSPVYSEVKSIIKNADLAFINVETVMAGTSFGYSGFPLFNTPQSMANALVDAGFEIMNLANNHAMDMGRNGLYATLDYLDTFEEITVIGARKEGESARLVTRNNITLGFLSYTFSLNGIPLPRDNPNLVSMIDRNKMTEEITALRPLCDFLIVSMHWGAEYLLQPDRSQTDLALFLAQLDVDLIIGHHPHVLQRMEKIPRPNGKETICFYSLGNFASHQRERERIIGAMIILTFEKHPDGELNISNYGLLPVITHYDRSFRNTKLYPLYSYNEELVDIHGLRNHGSGLSMDFFFNVLERLNTKIYMYNPYN